MIAYSATAATLGEKRESTYSANQHSVLVLSAEPTYRGGATVREPSEIGGRVMLSYGEPSSRFERLGP